MHPYSQMPQELSLLLFSFLPGQVPFANGTLNVCDGEILVMLLSTLFESREVLLDLFIF